MSFQMEYEQQPCRKETIGIDFNKRTIISNNYTKFYCDGPKIFKG